MAMNQEHEQYGGPTIEQVAYGDDTGIDPIVFNGVEHIPYSTFMSNRKTHVYFTPGGLSNYDQEPDLLKERALLKIDPRISYRHNGDHTTFHGFIISPEYICGKFSQPAFDWLMKYCDDINVPLNNTTSINKPTISLFMQKQESSYGFKPDSTDAIAEIIKPKETGELTKIRWLYNILPLEYRIRQVREHTFYEVCGNDEFITEPRRATNLGHHVVAMHTTYSRR